MSIDFRYKVRLILVVVWLLMLTMSAVPETLRASSLSKSVLADPAPNTSPEITEGASKAVTMSEDGSPTPFSLTLNATDVEGDTLTWSIDGAGASQGTAEITPPSTGNSTGVTYTPNANYHGGDSFVVKVDDGKATPIRSPST